MLLNEKEFYQDLTKYYDSADYQGAKFFLEAKEREIKYAFLPPSGCSSCGGGEEVDENGLTETTRNWIKKRNIAIAAILYEQGKVCERLGELDESRLKHEEAIKLLKRTGLKEDDDLWQRLFLESTQG